MKRKRILSGIVISVISQLFLLQSASAHGDITSTSPKINSVISVSPASIQINFDGNLIVIADKKSNFLTLSDSAGAEIKIGPSIVLGAKISAKILKPLIAGKYKVNWRIVSEDGHPVKGSYFFTVSSKAKS